MIELKRVWPTDAVLTWHQIGEALAPAIERAGKTQIEVLQHIVSREFQCWRTTGDIDGALVTAVGPTLDSAARCLWLLYAAGTVSGGPRARLKAMRALLGEFEQMAMDDGCTEVRFEGRKGWAVFKDYHPTGHPRHEMRKVL